ncbi:alpha/beta hydrolase family protein [Flavobacterium sp. W21_SRS_FM6]|uniref:alpha/beta hydrolase family protein n=1 Tax=Flavobacterium sp. W21_SRS_FM6 TaxID=3240268 RepID=UPI003F923E4A
MKPKGQTDLPVLVYNRGGNGRYVAVVFGSMMASLFPMAEQGFAIIGSQYRGSFDKEEIIGKSDEFGGEDVLDVVKLAKYIPYIKDVDSTKVGMYGSSRGGMQTFLAMQKMPEIKAVATIAGASDLLRELKFRQAMEKVYENRIPNYAANKEVELDKRSVLKWADKLNKNVPILIQHGDRDTRVSVENAKWLAATLAKLEHPHKLSIYKDEGHGFSPKTRPTAIKELADWFHQHL